MYKNIYKLKLIIRDQDLCNGCSEEISKKEMYKRKLWN